jgi:hypothetical protein
VIEGAPGVECKALACDEWIRLVLACSKAAWDYSEAVTLMGTQARSSNFEEYGQAWDVAESCRLILKQARFALNDHIAEHCCQAENLREQI